MKRPCSRRRFLGLAAGAPLALASGCGGGGDGHTTCCVPTANPSPSAAAGSGVVAITRARSYGAEAGAALRQALSAASREVIERVVWEVVPQLAETIIRENLDRLVNQRQHQ